MKNEKRSKKVKNEVQLVEKFLQESLKEQPNPKKLEPTLKSLGVSEDLSSIDQIAAVLQRLR